MSDANTSLPPPVVLGHGITSLGVIRSLGRRGLRPYLVAPDGDLATLSRWVRGRHLSIQETDDPALLAETLEQVGLEQAVLFACSDLWAQAVSRLSPELRRRYRSSSPTRDVLEVCVDKARFLAALVEHDVPHPRSRIVTTVEEVAGDEWRGSFLKPSESQRFSRVYGAKGVTLETLDDVRSGLQAMQSAGVTAILQEYVPGPPTCHYFVDGFVDRFGEVRALFARRRTRMYPVDYGNSTHMVTVSTDEVAPAIAALTRLLTGIGFRGAFSAEFKQDPRDGVFRLLEVNGRPWWYIGFAASCGVDVTSLAYDDALERPVATVHGYEVGRRCVLLHLDARAFLYERSHNGLGAGTWLRSVLGATPTVYSWRDPLPGMSLMAGIGGRGLRRARTYAGRGRRHGS